MSTNVPLDHWSYDAIERLIGRGLVDSGLMSTKPVSRLEMARLVAEALEKANRLKDDNEIVLAILSRLKEEFKAELAVAQSESSVYAPDFIKPLENPYLRYLYADDEPDLENQRGDVFHRRSNYRAGFDTRMKFFDAVAFYLHPEYSYAARDSDGDLTLIEAYAKFPLGHWEIELGRDSLWWGPAYHGSMIMSNNARAFKMVKVSNPMPVQLPWVLEVLGPFKATWFLTRLESDRAIPKARLTGLRLNFKPRPEVELGISRTIMFGGSNRPHVGLGDYLDMWRLQAEQEQNNQLAGFDASVILPLQQRMLPRSVKLYTEFAGEDEAGGLPAKWGRLFGVQLNDLFRNGATDLRIEYADNHVSGHPDVFYTHSIYQSGYTYEDQIIGHHMGTDSRDLFLRASHYLSKDVVVGAEFDHQVTGLSSQHRDRVNQFGFDVTLFVGDDWQLTANYRYQDSSPSYNLFGFKVVRRF